MRTLSNLIGAFVLSIMGLAVAVYAQQLGDNATIIVPAGKIANLRQVLVVKGAPRATATKVGSCAAGDVRLQDAEIVDRESPGGRASGADSQKLPTVATDVAIIVPGVAGFKELKPGWRLGSFRPGGKCGPGYDVYLAHIIAIE